MVYETILVNKDEGIGTITLNRPERLNAINPTMISELAEAVNGLAVDSGVRVVILTGAGRGFCAGADLTPGVWPTDSNSKILERTKRAGDMIYKLRTMAKPVIGAINGVAVGGGCGLALAPDFLIASQTARFAQNFAHIGLAPDMGGSYFLTRLVGAARANELLFTGRMVDAVEADKLGLVNKVVAPEELQRVTRDMALQIAQASPLALGVAKSLVYQGLAVDLATALDLEAKSQAVCRTSEEAIQARKAWAEKKGK